MFSELEQQIRDSLNAAQDKAHETGAHMMIVGILPTLGEQHLHARTLSANSRYALLNEQIFAARGEDLQLSIGGVERLSANADSIAPEAACTSFQLHQLVHPEDFARHWNAAQAIAGIQVAVGANSPFFFGKELWRETRIALFEQATDTRPEELKAQGVRPRVWFGERWITSIFDLFEENVRYFPALLPLCDEEDPVAVLERGDTPTLGELRLHNGTVYRWNRPVYEVVRGRPHVRVENRVLPAGPTVVDMLANAAFYYGLVRALVEHERPIWTQMSFSAAEDNLHAGARDGLDARVYWPGVGDVPVTELVLRRLLPLAHEGLELYGVDPHARDRLLGDHRAPLRRGGQRRDLAEPHVPAALRGRGPRPRRGAAPDDGALPRQHARQRARAHLAARLTLSRARRGRRRRRRLRVRRDRVGVDGGLPGPQLHRRRCAPARGRAASGSAPRGRTSGARPAAGTRRAPRASSCTRRAGAPAEVPARVELERGDEAGRRGHRVHAARRAPARALDLEVDVDARRHPRRHRRARARRRRDAVARALDRRHGRRVRAVRRGRRAAPTALHSPPATDCSTPSRAVPAGARPDSVSGSPASTPSGAAASVAARTSRLPLMNACSVQTNG